MNTKDTIIAACTPPGEGSIAIIRIAGPQSYNLLDRFFTPTTKLEQFSSHRLYHGFLHDTADHVLDEVMAVYMSSPHTYTRDDVVEIHCHGSRHIVRIIVNLFQAAGARLAEPGEFTYRAFVNGRIDLSQAEAVSRLIQSVSEASRKAALSQADGVLSKKMYAFTDIVRNVLALTEAWIDFPEEDLPLEDTESIRSNLRSLRDEIGILADSYQYGRVLHEGIRLALVGKPNVGKSTLMNILLGKDRAIVTDIPGTTRDVLEEGILIDGVPVRVADTAGLRITDDPVELEGIRRAEAKLRESDLILVLLDSSRPLDDADFYILDKCSSYDFIIVWTKSDLPQQSSDESLSLPASVSISSKNLAGIETLLGMISERFHTHDLSASDSLMISESRHFNCLLSARQYIDNALNILNDAGSIEFLAFELREVLYVLGQITGQTTSEDLLDKIFSGFCIGK